MAQKRMFDKRIVGTDKFASLSNTAKALYFLAGVEADDKGFFQPRSLQKIHGFMDDDYKLLIAKGYFIPFESGVMVITDWNKNNWLDSRRVTETEYTEELRLLKLINERYEISYIPNPAKHPLSENSIEENSIEENSIDKDKTRAKKFAPPTLEEVKQYCFERNNTIDPEYFVDHYTSNGWMVGKNKMKDWKSTVRNWEKRENEKPKAEAVKHMIYDDSQNPKFE